MCFDFPFKLILKNENLIQSIWRQTNIRINLLDIMESNQVSGEGNGTHSSTFAWKIPWMEEPDRLQSMGSLGVGYDWATSHSLFTIMHWRRKWQPTPVFLLGEFQGRGSLVGCRHGVTQSRTWLKWLSSSSNQVSLSNWELLIGRGKKLWESPIKASGTKEEM